MSTATFAAMLASGLATGIGGFGLLAFRSPGERTMAILLGFTGGVMLGATAFSLLVPALEEGGLTGVVLGFAAGCALMVALDRYVPHEHAQWDEKTHAAQSPLRRREAHGRARLLLSALTIHNIPEGLAVGLAFAFGGFEAGAPLALAIGIQNVPEGFAAAAPLIEAGTRRASAIGVAFATGAVEPPAALGAYFLADAVDPLLAPGLAFAGGAMLYVVVDELIPEANARGHERAATLALVAGFALLMVLDNALG